MQLFWSLLVLIFSYLLGSIPFGLLIVKLRTQDFDDEDEVHVFFKEELRSRTDGKFRIPAGWIAADGPHANEPLLFSYHAVVLYSAKARGGRRGNFDAHRDRYPYYFEVDVESICPVRRGVTLQELQERLERVTGTKRNIAKSQGWNSIPDSEATDGLWASLREPADSGASSGRS